MAGLVTKGFVKAILDKYGDSIIEKIKDFSKDEWEKFKIDFDIVFSKYLDNSYEKYSKIKTLLYRTEPKYIYDFFEYPTLKKGEEEISSEDINNVLDNTHFAIISGDGGIGKSTLLKHFFINELSRKDLIPVFVELKDLNDLDTSYEISDFVFQKLHNLGSDIKKDYIEYALKSGCFLFLFDGYDEILSSKKDYFFRKLTDFCDLYSDNYYIISSRPYSDFVEFQRFTVFEVCAFSKEQAMSLIEKIDYDKSIKSKFLEALEESLYDSHKSFASNPLLLNIMLLTYDNYAEIPAKRHIFYANAFDTLYSKHDATKGGYRRELKCRLSVDDFKKVFSCFCYITYYHGKIEMTRDEFAVYLGKAKTAQKISFNIEAMIDDLSNALCLMNKNGLNYRFTHRSFQEYFTALYLKELSDDELEKRGIKLIEKDTIRARIDETFEILYDMAKERTEHHIAVPILEKFEGGFVKDKYGLYYQIMHIYFFYHKAHFYHPYDDIIGSIAYDNNGLLEFVDKIVASKYYKINSEKNALAAKRMSVRLQNTIGFELDRGYSKTNLDNDRVLYNLFKETWLGQRITTMANLKETLQKNKLDSDAEFDALLD